MQCHTFSTTFLKPHRLRSLMLWKMAQYKNRLTDLNELITKPSEPVENLAEEVIKEKGMFQKASLELTIKLISERENAKHRNIASIASEIMDLQSQLYVYRCHRYPILPDNKRKSNLERAISELNNRRRQEEITCWKDNLKLWQELLKNAAEYKSTARKARILFSPY